MGVVQAVQPHFHVRIPGLKDIAADAWGGLAAMLVALPSAVAYGVAIYSVFGPEFIGQGAIAGVIGAAVLGIVAPAFGGTPRLISAPCAPAAAMMTALAAQLVLQNSGRPLDPQLVLLLLSVVAFSAGCLQLLYGLAGGGQLIKYIPFPVISGYLSGVAILVLLGQAPKLLGLPKGTGLWLGLITPSIWQWPGTIIGLATIAGVVVAPRLTKSLPAPIFGLMAGMLAYVGLNAVIPTQMQEIHQSLVVGSVGGGVSTVRTMIVGRWLAVGNLSFRDLLPLIVQPLTLSILLSIDTLKTCVIVDTLTRSRHHSNRELIGQGLANSISALVGGLPGGGVSGATLVGISSGARSKMSSLLEGVFVVVVFLAFGQAIGHLPIATLAGILIVVAARMIDLNAFDLLRQKATVLDFLVTATVVIVAVQVDLIAAAGVGLGLSILLFIREQIRGTVIRRKLHGDQISSKQSRIPAEKELLRQNGSMITVCQLQGSLFFGTTDQLFSELEQDLKKSRYLILDMTRVQSVDFTAVHMLEQIESILEDRHGEVVFSNLPLHLPTGQNLRTYLQQLQAIAATRPMKIFDTLDDALEWGEDRVLEECHARMVQADRSLELHEMDLLKGADEETLQLLRKCLTRVSYAAGDCIFKMGDSGDELFLIRRGIVRITLPLDGGRHYNVTTFARGDFFGDMAFLDSGQRSADARTAAPTEVFTISRARFDEVVQKDARAGGEVFAALARALAIRLRYADSELRAIQES